MHEISKVTKLFNDVSESTEKKLQDEICVVSIVLHFEFQVCLI